MMFIHKEIFCSILPADEYNFWYMIMKETGWQQHSLSHKFTRSFAYKYALLNLFYITIIYSLPIGKCNVKMGS